MAGTECQTTQDEAGREASPTVAKLCGADVELGNMCLGADQPARSSYEASAAVLKQVDGLPKQASSLPPVTVVHDARPTGAGGETWQWVNPAYTTPVGGAYWGSSGYAYSTSDWDDGCTGSTASHNPQDYARRWLTNGGCIYGDLGHCEAALPITRSAFDSVAYFRAMLCIVRDAMDRANAVLPPGKRIVMTVNNTDGHSHSWGGHTNFAITTRCYEGIFERKLHHALFLASFLTSSIVYTGAGKVGSENGMPEADFLLTQRGDFYETLTGTQTTYRRPIINSRNEPLASLDSGISRLHCIFFDSTLAEGSSVLKWGVTQLVLAMIEQGIVPPDLILEDPLEALAAWNRDPDLEATARVISGHDYTAVDMQWEIFRALRRFVDAGRVEGLVPRAAEIMDLWEDTLTKLARRDLNALIPRIEWVLKRYLLDRAVQRRHLDWGSAEIKHLDHAYSNLDLNDGLYWQIEKAGQVERYVSAAEVARAVREPPADTRAWLRGHLLSRVDDGLDDVDWDQIRYRVTRKYPGRTRYTTLKMDNPLSFTQDECESICARTDLSFEELLVALGGKETDAFGRPFADKRRNTTAKLLPAVQVRVKTHNKEGGVR